MGLAVNPVEQESEEFDVAGESSLDDILGEPPGVPIAVISIAPGLKYGHQ
jgi:hypothetical protein